MPSARSRQERRKNKGTSSTRTAGVLRGGILPQSRAERSALQHGVRDGVGVSWRAVSGLIIICLLGVLFLFFGTDFFYVRNIRVAGADYLDESEIFRYADIAEAHIFWLDPPRIRQNILDASPVIAEARVVVGWPPDMVRIVIEEREPALIWIQSGVAALVDIQGRVLRFPPDEEVAQYPNLLRVIVDPNIIDPPLPNEVLDVNAVNGALQLQNLLAGIQELRYDPINGLGYREPGTTWDVWLGTGIDMDQKLLIYETLSNNLRSRGIIPLVINVVNPASAYYCGSIEFCNG